MNDGYILNGVKSFGCATGVADRYLVTASLEGYDTAAGLCTFFVERDAPGVSEREHWDAIGMRGPKFRRSRAVGLLHSFGFPD